MSKKHRFYHNLTIGNIIIFILVILLLSSFFVNKIVINKIGNVEKNNQFVEEDWNYMISYIENNFGNGDSFTVTKKYTEKITKKSRSDCLNDYEIICYEDIYIGEKAFIIGYFNNKKGGYFVSFSRYVSESPYKSGNNVIICTYTQENYPIEESDI